MLLAAAKRKQEKEERGEKAMHRNPFKKAWGLQKDGDLWEQAWKAVLNRGAANQDPRKVKGHATIEDIKAGRSIDADKKGNDKSDENADKRCRDDQRERPDHSWRMDCSMT